ncbi:unnamed protein product [Kuraishia capsulata CBS 1993]|uniref:Vacuolar import/degradation Vid27 C-terminal domain-containing protein n=1 Tax=Kuraishia capsulata CBS 1993 TaxID=1382522 RepID=W6MUB6_9ASCO|nr:uncharacterized protein KUCA_T00005084001 [Kuraishia capsulata CBS 1993]CDK29097.1 unnamed protein product [Kuraishia capsulata CBS 1993]
MNFIRKLLSSSPKDELVVIPSGQLYLVRSPTSPKGESECLYNDVVASIRETSIQYNYQLIIQKAFEEGEVSDREEDNDESSVFDDLEEGKDDDWTFLIDETLKFSRSVNKEGDTVIRWKDNTGDMGDYLQLLCDRSVKPSLLDQFMTTLYKCQFERKYKRSALSASESDLEEFKVGASQAKLHIPGYSNDADGEDDSEDEFHDANDVNDEEDLKDPHPMRLPAGKVLSQGECQLHLYDPVKNSFILQNETVIAKIIDLGNWNYWLSVVDRSSKGRQAITGSFITPDLNPVCNDDALAFIFNYVGENLALSWLLKFENLQKLEEFNSNVKTALWESLNRTKLDSVSESDSEYVLRAFDNLNVNDDMDAEFEEESEDEFDSAEESLLDNVRVSNLRQGTTRRNFSDDDDDSDRDETKERFEGSESNKGLKVGYKNDRTYVARGNRLGVFTSTEDNDLKFYTAIENIKNSKGQYIDPSKMMLHQEDRAMIIQDDSKPFELYKMDLEYGKIVEDWQVSKDNNVPVVEFGPSQKFSQMTGEQTFMGISSNGLFKLDPRLSGSKLVEGLRKTYKTKVNFTALATTELGFMAVANESGEIRLYDKLGGNAKTQLPGLGERIIGIDTSNDGRWLLATCKTYLLLIDTKITDGKNAGAFGFTRSFGKDSKPRPRRLQLTPENVAFIRNETGTGVVFTKARFNTGVNVDTPQTIVSSTGPYVITWSFNKVLRNDPQPYLVNRYEDTVMAEDFRFGSDSNVILALKDDVAMANKKSFKKPTNVSLTGKKKALSKTEVVYSPY